MALVIDASVAAAWCLRDEEGSLRAGAVMARVDEERAIVPSLFWHEIVNILIVAERRKRLERLESDRCLEDLRRLGLVTDAAQDYQATLALARRRNLSGYDAAYLETAKRHDAEVATLDRLWLGPPLRSRSRRRGRETAGAGDCSDAGRKAGAPTVGPRCVQLMPRSLPSQ